MRSLKKFMAAGLAAAMVFSMTAFSSKPAETAAPETQAETTADTTMNDGWCAFRAQSSG